MANFGGFKRIITVDFALFNDGTDKSTSSDSIITLRQQKEFLQETVIQGVGSGDSQADVTYTLTIYEDSTTKTYTGGIEDISIRAEPGTEGTLLRGTLNLLQGTN